jgi:hypothetical protein
MTRWRRGEGRRQLATLIQGITERSPDRLPHRGGKGGGQGPRHSMGDAVRLIQITVFRSRRI